MCRLCPTPEWGDPIKVPVAELPAYFAQQISWNFERLNFGNGAVIDSESGRAERPSVTGRVGCKLKEGMKPLNKAHADNRYLLVSECLYCPGRRYGCTPRANCTGKRRHCYAMCKVSVYASDLEMAEVYFSGSHGEGNVTDVNKHRLSSAIKNELKRRRLDGASTDEALMWFKKFVKDQGLDDKDPRLVPNDDQVRQMLKRLTPSSRPTMAHQDGQEHSSIDGDTTMEEHTNTEESSESNHEQSSSEVPWSAVTIGEPTGNTSDENEETPTKKTIASPPASRAVHVTFPPHSSTPLNTPITLQSTHGFTGESDGTRAMAQHGRSLYVSHSPAIRPPALSYSSYKTGVVGGGLNLSKREANIQLEGKEQEMAVLRHHIRILEQENLSKISRIAELEMQLHTIKEKELIRLGTQIQRLETDNLKKDVRILQLEKHFQEQAAINHVTPQPSTTALNSKRNAGNEAQTVVELDGIEVDHVTGDEDTDTT